MNVACVLFLIGKFRNIILELEGIGRPNDPLNSDRLSRLHLKPSGLGAAFTLSVSNN